MPRAFLIGLVVFLPMAANSGEAAPPNPEAVPHETEKGGGVSTAPLDPVLAGRLPGRPARASAQALGFGAILSILNTGGSGETIPPAFVGGD